MLLEHDQVKASAAVCTNASAGGTGYALALLAAEWDVGVVAIPAIRQERWRAKPQNATPKTTMQTPALHHLFVTSWLSHFTQWVPSCSVRSRRGRSSLVSTSILKVSHVRAALPWKYIVNISPCAVPSPQPCSRTIFSSSFHGAVDVVATFPARPRHHFQAAHRVVPGRQLMSAMLIS
jgi:hypothetical protein